MAAHAQNCTRGGVAHAFFSRTGGRGRACKPPSIVLVETAPDAAASGRSLPPDVLVFVDAWVWPSAVLRWDGDGECPF